MENVEVPLVCGMVICLAAGGIWDLCAGRIPNLWLAFWFTAGLVYFIYSGWLAAAGYLVRIAVTVSVFFLLFLCRMMGAADIKCMALICGYLGFGSGVQVIGAGMVIGAFWSLFRLVVRKSLGDRLCRLAAYIRQTIHLKQLMVYHSPGKEGKEGVIPLVFCLFWGLAVCVLWKGGWCFIL